ncbi:SIMPL domain-containing protein [Microbacterium radiodurans]|uniref:SIMPL domain-containing protein n=1 Tax=Microbacterium radiodurans TaxID=661398 RepID=A0A5J5IQR6_9MICO|nr:SIMPL domain-containing protein [Microbacterium radiodurans]KAA9086966.1 SIMPL domain-containing protein [Microbacterium radiodurans]
MAEIVITVRGDAETHQHPELAVLHLAVAVEGDDRDSVVARATDTLAAVRDGLERSSSDGSVSTWTAGTTAVWSDRPWDGQGQRRELVHHATVPLTATFVDVGALSTWVAATARLDDVRISHVDWQLTPGTRTRLERDVATTAVRRAVDRAAAYATALGRTSVEALEIADTGLLSGPGSPGAPEMRFARAAAFGDAGGGQIDLRPDDIVVTASVEGRFSAK